MLKAVENWLRRIIAEAIVDAEDMQKNREREAMAEAMSNILGPRVVKAARR